MRSHPAFVIWFQLMLACQALAVQEIGERQSDEQFVKGFQLEAAIVRVLMHPAMISQLELSNEQKSEFISLVELARQKLERIRNDEGASFRERRERLNETCEKVEEEIRGILLPHQVKMIDELPFQLAIAEEGMARSLSDGLFGSLLDLSVEERQRVHEAATAAKSEYLNQVRDAQNRAVERLREALPQSKRAEFDRRITLMRSGEDFLWSIDYRMIDPEFENKRMFRLSPTAEGTKR